MSTVDQTALNKLLASAERAASKTEAASKAISLKFSQASLPQYHSFDTQAEKATCHANLLLCEKTGAISIEWDSRAGERGQVLGIRLNDAQALATHLGIKPRWERVEYAKQILSPFFDKNPVLTDVLDCWSRGVKVRDTEPEDAQEWMDAIRVIEACFNINDEYLRRLSSQLFSDTKRIENLMPLIDVLDAQNHALPPRSREELSNKLGLIDFPKEWMVAGDFWIDVGGRSVQCALPYSSFAAEFVQDFTIESSVHTVLSIENKTTFWEGARSLSPNSGVILLYTAGMPSPNWRQAYSRLIKAAPHLKFAHWGDIDAGGFRIADLIASTAKDLGKPLDVYLMNASSAKNELGDGIERKRLTQGEVNQIQRICAKHGWNEEAKAIQENPLAYEQESLRLVIPGSDYF